MTMRNSTCFRVAALLATLLFPFAAAASPCSDSVRGKIAWDGAKNMNWTPANLERLCRGAENSAEPGACFRQVMTSNSVSWGGGTQWKPDNAVRLCAGAASAQQRIGCFQSRISAKVSWGQAADQCQASGSQQVAQAPRPVQATQAVKPAAPAPASQGGETVEQAQQREKAMTCKGPLDLEYLASDDRNAQHQFVVNFVAADSAASLRPGQCWRATGWNFPTSLGSRREGRLTFSYPLGSCPLFQSMKLSGGKVTDFAMTLQGRGGQYGSQLFEAAAKPGGDLQVNTRFLFGPNIGTAGATYRVSVPEGDIFRPERCR
jgi:hypothetical protein